MKFVLASYGSRGDVEPCAALARELQDRGHEVRLAVAPDLIGFAEFDRASGGSLRSAYATVAGRAPRLLDAFIPQILEGPGPNQLAARRFEVVQPVPVTHQHDADSTGRRG